MNEYETYVYVMYTLFSAARYFSLFLAGGGLKLQM